MRHTFRLPGPDGPEVSVDHSPFTGLRVYAGGEPIARLRQGGRPAYAIPTSDGSTRTVRFAGQMTGLQALVDDGTTIQLERRLSLWELVLTLLPFGLVGVAGIVGGLAGLVAVLANLRIARQPWPPAARAVAALASLAIAALASLAVTFALSMILRSGLTAFA